MSQDPRPQPTVILTDRFHRAMVYAATAHDGHLRKGTSIPYVSHLLIVAGLVLEHGGNEDAAIAALLHDAVEDQGGEPRLQDIRAHFGDAVADTVSACTHTDVISERLWRDRRERYLEHLASASDAARLVSASDKLANVRSIVQDYRAIGDALWGRFNASRDDHLWYYRALADTFSELGPQSLARELEAGVAELERLVRQSMSES